MKQQFNCGRIFPSYGGCDPKDKHGCILPNNHDGPHKFLDEDGQKWAWETDLNCSCEHCIKADGDYCADFWPEVK